MNSFDAPATARRLHRVRPRDVAGRMCTVPRPYPREFRDDVVRVARNREPGVTIEQIAADFGITRVVSAKWMRQADIDDGAQARARPPAERPSCVSCAKRIRLLEQENEVLRRAAAYLSQANLPGK